MTADRRALPVYTPPPDDEPLDAVQLILVRMFRDIVVARIREKRARAAREADAEMTDPEEDAKTGPKTTP